MNNRERENIIRNRRRRFSGVPELAPKYPKFEPYIRRQVDFPMPGELPLGVEPVSFRDVTGRYVSTGLLLERAFLSQLITIGTSPTLILKSTYTYPYAFLNPAATSGEISTGTHYSGTITANGNTQSSPLNVSNYQELHMYIDITAVSGTSPTLDVYLQSQSPSSSNWVDVQQLWSSLNSTGTYYNYVGALGVAENVALRWVIGGTNSPSFTVTLEYILKIGLGATSATSGNTIYLGGSGVTTVSGYPLLSEKSEVFIIKEGVEIYGVAASSLELRIFEL